MTDREPTTLEEAKAKIAVLRKINADLRRQNHVLAVTIQTVRDATTLAQNAVREALSASQQGQNAT